MTEQMLFRFAMILQDQAPSTLNKYICKLAETVLLDYPDGVSLFKLNQTINDQFNLSFTEDEIRRAITKKGANRIVIAGENYLLTPSAKSSLSSQLSIAEKLKNVISDFINSKSLDISVEMVFSLLQRYLYYCFNSNVDNLMSLYEGRIVSNVKAFEATSKELSTINAFVTWENKEKNSLVFTLIATCYEYCMLTIKKDNILSVELFKGKRFYLDANIIFRMVGINNEERKTVTTQFVNHCQKVGIELYCTGTTLDEVYRVITAQVSRIRDIAGLSMPVDSIILDPINPTKEINGFYKLYCEWCHISGNKCGDYVSFSQYLFNLVQDTISQLKIRDSGVYKAGTLSEQFNERVTSLKDYKNSKRSWRQASTISAETDVTNIMDTLTWRRGTGTSIWQTNDFVVSADQLLINWVNDTFSGVPIVVFPSVWLSIILRFTGRTDDDYKSFCLFLTQSQHVDDGELIDTAQLLKNINAKTTKVKIKEQIIVEIIQNKSQYTFGTPEDYDLNIARAFDKIMEEKFGELEDNFQNEMQQRLDALAKSSQAHLEEERIEAAAEKEKIIITISKKQASDKVKTFRKISNYGWVVFLIVGLIIIAGVFIYIFELPPYFYLYNLLPEKIKTIDSFIAVWTVISIGISLVALGIRKLVSYLGSENREQNLYRLYYSRNKSTLEANMKNSDKGTEESTKGT